MRKLPSFLLLLAILTACTPAPASSGTAPATPGITPTAPPPCSAIAAAPTPGPDVPSLFAPESSTDRARGAQAPIVTLIEYTDYQDFMSHMFSKEVTRLLETHPDELRVVTRLFPQMNANDKAALAAQAVEAAAEQGKLWEMHDLLFAQQQNWADLSVADFEQWLTAQASALGMNVNQFQADVQRADIAARVQQAWESGKKIGLPGTPIVLINGQIYSGPLDYNSLNDIIELIVLGKRQYTTCPPVTVQPDKEYIATLHTEKGEVVIQLFADKAPMTVNSFLFLADSGWYNDITFHRVIPELFAQTGDPSGTGRGNPGYYIITEIDPALTFDRPGLVAMVNSGPDTSGSQFFITYAPIAKYNGQYTIFGEVLTGMEVLQQLTPRDPKPGEDTPPGDRLISITVEEK